MRFADSKQRVEEASGYVPGGVNSNFRLGIPPTPLVFDRATGPYLVDVDGNRLIDYFLGMGPMLLGHSPQPVISAVRDQLDRSILVGGQTQLEYDAARLLVDLVPSVESVRFSSSGSEADQTAIRLARAATRRDIVIKFEGHYHGWIDNVLFSNSPDLEAAGPADAPNLVPGSEGQAPPWGLEVMLWNDADAIAKRLARRDVAAVIMEPVMFNSAGILPLPGYLEAVRAACDETGTLLIFDEVITGFRVSPGGAQQELGIRPDITVLGKALAGGFPVAAIGGRADLMELISDRRVLHGGTYNTQSIAMAATLATLREIASGAPHAHIAEVGGALMTGLRDTFERHGLQVSIVGYPAVFHVRFGALDARDYRDSLAADRARYGDFAYELLRRGVRVLARGTWFLSSAHSMDDIMETLGAVDDVLASA